MSDFLIQVRTVLTTQLFVLGETSVNLGTLLTSLIILGVSVWVSRLAQRGARHFLERRGVREEGSIGVTSRLLHYVIMAMGFGVAFHTLGLNLTALFTAGAVFAIALGFAMQNIAQNFVSGLILLTERTIKPGDILGVDGRTVRVIRMGIRATVVRTTDEEDLIVPNSNLVQSTVVNFTLRDTLYRVRTVVGVVYSADLAQVRQVLETTAASLEWRDSQRDPVVVLKEFGSSSVDYEVSVWIEDPWNYPASRSMLNEAIWWALKDAGIVIAFPQLDVHFDAPVVSSLERLGPK